MPNCELLFQAHSTDGRDIHTEMNSTVFENYVTNQLLPELDTPSVVVMDNASYHSRVDPETASPTFTKKQMQKWLIKNIPFADYYIQGGSYVASHCVVTKLTHVNG